MSFSFDEYIGMLTNETNRNIVRYLTIQLERYNITPAQWFVLFKLSQQDKISQKELACKTNKDQPTLARILDILEHKEWVERQANKDDRRSFIILLTPKGAGLVQELVTYMENIFSHMVRDISKDHLEIYVQTLHAINRNIMDDIENHSQTYKF